MNALAAFTVAPTYPAGFPLPDRAPYSIGVDMGVVRSAMAAGNFRQRRNYRNMPQGFALSFRVDTAGLADWQAWANANGWDWFYLPLASMYAPTGDPGTFGAAGLVSLQLARFTSDLAISLDSPDCYVISVAAELSPDMFAAFARPFGLDRIDGLHPADALADIIDGGSPHAPSLGGPVDGGNVASLGVLP